jgi:ribosomal protein L37AE/L43A
VAPPDPLPHAADPTAACAKCHSIAVYLAEDNILVCAKCGALLDLEIAEVAPG